jgi:hypothetical protein
MYWGCLRTMFWTEYFCRGGMKWRESGENCITRIFVTCTLHQVKLEYLHVFLNVASCCATVTIYIYIYIYMTNKSIPSVATLCSYFWILLTHFFSRHVSAPRAIIRWITNIQFLCQVRLFYSTDPLFLVFHNELFMLLLVYILHIIREKRWVRSIRK